MHANGLIMVRKRVTQLPSLLTQSLHLADFPSCHMTTVWFITAPGPHQSGVCPTCGSFCSRQLDSSVLRYFTHVLNRDFISTDDIKVRLLRSICWKLFPPTPSCSAHYHKYVFIIFLVVCVWSQKLCVCVTSVKASSVFKNNAVVQVTCIDSHIHYPHAPVP